eukprot:1996036-Pyramimonas_sp.AAC.1
MLVDGEDKLLSAQFARVSPGPWAGLRLRRHSLHPVSNQGRNAKHLPWQRLQEVANVLTMGLLLINWLLCK